MNSISNEMDFFSRLMKGLAAQFGSKCEVVLHDYEKDYESTIVQIENGHVTGRSAGDCGTNLGLEVLRGTVADGDKYNYITQTKDGKILHSTSIYIRNNEGKAIGALCINWDVTEMYACQNVLKDIIGMRAADDVKEVITNDVSDLLDELIQESIRYVGKPVANMTREDKMKGLKYLDAKGAFLIKKAGEKVIQFYDISKYTLYNYLDKQERGISHE